MPRKAIYGVTRVPFNSYAPIPAGTGAVEHITDWVGGFGYVVESVKAYVAVAGTGTSASRTFRVLKGASTVVATGTVTLAGTDTVGKEIVLTVTPANAEFSDADVLTIDWPAAGAVAFTAGALNVVAIFRHDPQRVR